MHKIQLLGNVGQDATVNDLPNGNQVVNFSIAVTEKYNDQSKTTWYKCAYFKNDARIAQYIKKGIKLLVIGKPELETYTSNTGDFKVNIKCIVQEIHFASSLQEKQSQSQPIHGPEPIQHTPGTIPEPPSNQDEHDDLPF